jgi:outer membrane protein, multidrug efflux system
MVAIVKIYKNDKKEESNMKQISKQMTINKLAFLATSAAFLLAGCVSVPKLDEHSVQTSPDINNIYSLSGNMPQIQTEKWWETFHDTQLNELIVQVLKNNSDMKIAQLNVEKSQQQIQLAKSAFLPEVDAGASLQREKLSENGLYPPPLGGSTINFSQLDLQTSYTFDFFGQVSSLVKQADNQKEGLILKEKYLQLNLANQAVKLYGYWQYLNEQQDLLKQQQDLATQVLALTEKRLALGSGLKEDVLSAQNNLKNVQISLSQNQQNIKLTEDALQLLAGSYNISQLKKNSQILENLKAPIDAVSSNTVKNRPDVAFYLSSIEAQRNYLRSLKADFYPTISISGQVGFQKIGIGQLLRASNIFTDIGPSISLPIFDSGRIKGNYKVAGVDLNIVIEQYNQAVLKSFYDINDNLYKSKTNWDVLEKYNANFGNQTQTYKLNEQRYKIGTLSTLDWNKTQVDYINNQIQDKTNQYDYFTTQVGLILSLGGVAQ